MKGQQTKLQRKRKALLLLPLVVIPFLTMTFWAMGGGKGEAENKEAKREGLNLQLPSAQLSDERDKTKLGFYEAEEKVDTGNAETAPDFSFVQRENLAELGETKPAPGGSPYDPTPPGFFSAKDLNEEKVYQKLAALNRELTRQGSSAKKERIRPVQNRVVSVETEDVNRLAEMMQTVQSRNEPDTELEQLNGMMEKILDIQHPNRVKEKLQQESKRNQQQVYAVASVKNDVVTSLLKSGKEPQKMELHNSFFDEKESGASSHLPPNAIAAVIQENQSVTTGSTVKLRLTTDVFVGGILLPKGTFVFGTASLEEDRLKIAIPAIRHKENLLPVSLTVYDLDGLEGVHIPGTITRDVAKQTAEQSLQSIGLLSFDPSLKSQATAAAIGAAKGLLSKKVKQVKVVLKSGYQVLLRNNNLAE